jgi:hypothetical protein
MTRQQRRAAERATQKRGDYAEVICHDETAASLAHLFLPPSGSHMTGQELQEACERLAEATRAVKQLERERRAGTARVQ